MQDKNDVDNRPKIVVRDVPGEFVVDDFMDRYSRYLDAAKAGRRNVGPIAPGFVTTCGFILTICGALMVIFGPSSVRYSYSTGPTFFQYLQMYPGLITVLGFVITSVGRFIDAHDNTVLKTPEQFLWAHYELEFPRASNGPRLFSTVHMEGGTFKAFERP